MLKEKLEKNILVLEKVDDWKSSIIQSSKLLLDKKYITQNYVEAMIQNIKKMGPYVVIADDVAMPHSRPEDGVNKTSLSLLKLNEPVIFGENGVSVKIIITLAAENSNSHIDMITELVKFLQDDKKFKLLLNAKTKDEILNIL